MLWTRSNRHLQSYNGLLLWLSGAIHTLTLSLFFTFQHILKTIDWFHEHCRQNTRWLISVASNHFVNITEHSWILLNHHFLWRNWSFHLTTFQSTRFSSNVRKFYLIFFKHTEYYFNHALCIFSYLVAPFLPDLLATRTPAGLAPLSDPCILRREETLWLRMKRNPGKVQSFS